MATKQCRKTVKDDTVPVSGPKTKTTPIRAPRQPRSRNTPSLKPWAYTGVGMTLGLSAWLNGLAFSESAPTPAHGWVLGVTIPLLILVFSRTGAVLYGRGLRQLAYAAMIATLSILLLSVQHCATSIARLTGEPIILAALMSLSVDCGLVVCELATVADPKNS